MVILLTNSIFEYFGKSFSFAWKIKEVKLRKVIGWSSIDSNWDDKVVSTVLVKWVGKLRIKMCDKIDVVRINTKTTYIS